MNTMRILLGGLVAGLVINVSETVLNLVVLADVTAEMQMASWGMAGYILTSFLLGIVAVWIYAAIRPRFGSGPMTALTAGLALWTAAMFVPTIWMMAGGYLAAGAGIIGMIWTLFEVPLATMAGAWLYKEVEAPAAAAAPAHPPM